MVGLPSCLAHALIWLIKTAMLDLMPPAAGMPGLGDTRLDEFLRRLQRETTGLVWLGLVLGALVWVSLPIVTVTLPLPSFWLPARQRELHAQRLTTTSIYLARQSVFLLKMYACMCWGQDPDVRQRLALAPYPEDPGSFRVS